MLLDPFEEQFDLPACFAERAYGGRRQGRVVGQEDQRLARVGILEANAAQLGRAVPLAVIADQYDDSTANDASVAIDLSRIEA